MALTTLAVMAGCAERSAPDASEPPATATPSRTPTQDVFDGRFGSYTAARTTLVVDAQEEPAERARCTRTVDESTEEPILRLTVENQYEQPLALVVLSDDDAFTVRSAIVFRGNGAALTGVEGKDGSTLQAEGDRMSFTVTGSLKDEADGTEHVMELQAVCDLS